MIGLLALVAVVTVLTIYVVARTAPQIAAAREILSGNVANLSTSDIALAEMHLSAAHKDLHGLAASILRIVPVERQNIDVVRNGVDDTLPVLARARARRRRPHTAAARGGRGVRERFPWLRSGCCKIHSRARPRRLARW